MNRADPLKIFRNFVDNCTNGVIFTGAGISTESGIPDFRSPGGIWTKYQPIDFSDFMSSEEMRRESWRRKFATQSIVEKAVPNQGHQVVARWVQAGNVSCVITQNIDGLHQISGIPDNKVIELHGNATYAHCLSCYKRFELEDIRRTFEDNETLPVCDVCGGIIKTATISFGQNMPAAEMEAAEKAVQACDLFIAMGSSLVVYPAAGFPYFAKQNGARLVILNREPTPLDEVADVVINAEIGATLMAIENNKL